MESNNVSSDQSKAIDNQNENKFQEKSENELKKIDVDVDENNFEDDKDDSYTEFKMDDYNEDYDECSQEKCEDPDSKENQQKALNKERKAKEKQSKEQFIQSINSNWKEIDLDLHAEKAWKFYREKLGSPRYVCAPMVDQSELAFR